MLSRYVRDALLCRFGMVPSMQIYAIVRLTKTISDNIILSILDRKKSVPNHRNGDSLTPLLCGICS